MLYENRVTFKKFGGTPQNMTWWEFYQKTVDIFGSSAAGEETWQNYFGEEIEPPKTEESTPKENAPLPPVQTTPKPAERPKKEPVAPAQKFTEIKEKKGIDKSTEITCTTGETGADTKPEAEEIAEEKAEEAESSPEAVTEVVEKPYGSRKDYIDSLTAYGMACYLIGEYRNKSFQLSFLENLTELENWLKESVDGKGYAMEEDNSIPGQMSVEEFL